MVCYDMSPTSMTRMKGSMQSMMSTSSAMLIGVNWFDVSGGAVSHGGANIGSHAHAATDGSIGELITRQSASFV